MKKTKKLFAAFLSVLIILAALPIGAYASEAVISKAELQVQIAPGIDINDFDSYIDINTEGLELYETYITDDYNYDYLDSGDFQMGENYYIYIDLKPKAGYKFPDSYFEYQNVTINGEEVSSVLCEKYHDDGTFGILSLYYEVTVGGEISDVAVELDIYGDFSAYNYYRYARITSNGLDFMDSTYDAVLVYDKNGNQVEGKFEAGEEYFFEIFLSPKTNCSFAKNDQGEFELNSVKVNGKNAEYKTDKYETNQYYEFIKIEASAIAKTANYITDIDVDVNTDLANVYVDEWNDYITIHTEGLLLEDGNGDPAVFAFDSEGNPVDQFLSGDTYYLYVYFTPAEGYIFTEDFSFDSVTVNGEESYIDDFGSYITDDGREIFYAGVEVIADLENGGFFANIINFLRSIINWLMSMFMPVGI